jgi:hypothetical protein
VRARRQRRHRARRHSDNVQGHALKRRFARHHKRRSVFCVRIDAGARCCGRRGGCCCCCCCEGVSVSRQRASRRWRSRGQPWPSVRVLAASWRKQRL